MQNHVIYASTYQRYFLTLPHEIGEKICGAHVGGAESGGGGAPLGGSAASGPGTGGGRTGNRSSTLNNLPINQVKNVNDIDGILTNNSKKTIYYKPNSYNDWDALPLRPGEQVGCAVDGIWVDGRVYKIVDGYNYVTVNSSNKVEFDYPLLTPAYPRVYEVDKQWLNETMYNEDGSAKYVEWPKGSGKWFLDTQWWNIFNPTNLIPDPRPKLW